MSEKRLQNTRDNYWGLVPYCSCCECRGKHCLMYHPGHSHKYSHYTDFIEDLECPTKTIEQDEPSNTSDGSTGNPKDTQ